MMLKGRSRLWALSAAVVAVVVLILVWVGRSQDPPPKVVAETPRPTVPAPATAEAPAPTLRAAPESPVPDAVEDSVPSPASPEGGVTGIDVVLRTPEGRGVGGVTVRLINIDARPPTVEMAAVSDDQGVAQFRDVPLANSSVDARGAGWVASGLTDAGDLPAALRVKATTGRIERVEVALAPAARLEGRITGDGAPVPHAEVQLLDGRDPTRRPLFAQLREERPLDVTRADAQGRFAFAGLVPEASYRVRASSIEHLPAIRGPFPAAIDMPVRVDLGLVRGRQIEIRVVSDEGAPVPNARVFTRERSGPADLIGVHKRWRTDGQGRVVVGPIGAGEVFISVHARGFVHYPPSQEAGPWAAGLPKALRQHVQEVVDGARVPPDVTEHEIRLSRGLSISGRVVGADGEPMAGVQVQALKHETSEGGGYSITGLDYAMSEANGTFRIAGLPPGPLRLSAVTHGEGAQGVELDVEGGQRDIVVSFADAERRGFALTIVDDTGNPVPRVEARVQGFIPQEVEGGRLVASGLFDEDMDTWVDITNARDAAGEPLPLAAARWHWHPGDPREATIRLERGATLRGRVLAPGGDGQSGVRVEARQGKDGVRVGALTDAEGRFAVHGAAPGGHQIHIEVPEPFVPIDDLRAEAGGAELTIQLRRGVRPTVRVLDEQGEPIHGALVMALETGGLGESLRARWAWMMRGDGAHTAEGGSIRLPRLDPERLHALMVKPPEERSDLRERTIDGWTPEDTTIRLERGAPIAGVLLDLDDAPIEHARVVVADQTTSTDEAGRFEIPCLPRGTLKLTVHRPGRVGRHVPWGDVETVQAGDRSIVIRRERGRHLTVTVGDRKPDERLQAYLLPAGVERRGNKVLAVATEAEFRFPSLEAGLSYTLWIPPTKASPDLSLFRTGISAGSGGLSVVRRQGRTIRGRILGVPAGRESSLSVTLERGGAALEAQVQDDASFVARGLAQGSWRVHAVLWGDGPMYYASFSVRDDDGIELHLEVTSEEEIWRELGLLPADEAR